MEGVVAWSPDSQLHRFKKFQQKPLIIATIDDKFCKMSVGLTLVLLSPLVEILVWNHRQFCNTLSIFDIKSLTIFVTKSSIIDVKQGSKYTSEFLDFVLTNFFNFCNSRSSHRRCSIKKTFRSATLFKRDFTQCFPVDIAKC